MKKKTIIIATLSALVLAGATVGAVYALDKGISSDVIVPNKTAVLVKDDPSIEVDLADALAYEGVSHSYDTCTEDEKTYFVERAKVRSVIDEVVADALAENPSIENIGVDEDYCIDMTREQIELYVNLIMKKGNKKDGVFFGSDRLCAQAKGKIPLDAPRLTVEALDKTIKQSSSFSDLVEKLVAQYGLDYYASGSGAPVGCFSFDLDDEGSKNITFSFGWGEYEIYLYGDGNKTVLYSDTDLKALYGEE